MTGDQLKILILKAKTTQRALAKHAGMSIISVHYMCNGKRNITKENESKFRFLLQKKK
jgi:plasmid maintenance system antidote protein VapI